MQQFLGDLESGLLTLEAHCLALAITKKTLMKIASELPRKPWIENHHLSR